MSGSEPPKPKPSSRPTSIPPPRASYRAPKTGSGQHPAVRAYRDKLQSIHDHTVPAVAALDEDLQRILANAEPDPFPPPKL